MEFNNIKSLIDNVVFLDLETSGLSPYNSEILEIGAIKVENQKITSFHTFVKNKKEVPLEIFSLCTGLTQRDLDKAPSLNDISSEFIRFIGKKTIVCHNAEFEKKFLQYNFSGVNNKIIDSMELAVVLEPYHKEFNLEYLKNNITNDNSKEKHRALDDTLDTIKVVNALLMRLYDEEKKTMSLENLTFKINSYFSKFGIEKWTWSYFIDNADYNLENIDVKYDNDEKSEKFTKINMKSLIDEYRYGYEYLLKREDIWQSKKGFSYEFRSGQFELTKEIRETMNTRGENLACIEAPTGIGKSVGYLLPSILECYLNDKRIIISTDTKELQTQLIKKDIPNVIESLGLKNKVSFGYIKGKSNYICVEKLEKYKKEYESKNPNSKEILSILILERLVKNGLHGDIEEINYRILNNFNEILTHLREIACDPNLCKPKKCFRECLYKNRVEELKEEDITVVNHSLLAKWPYKDEKPIENLIVDEAHNLVEKGYDFFASEIEYRSLKYFLQEIYPTELILNSPFAYKMKGKRVIKPFDRFYYYIKLEADNKKKIGREINLILEEMDYILYFGKQNNYSTLSNYNLNWEINLQADNKAGSLYKDKRIVDINYRPYGDCIKTSLDKILNNLKRINYILDRQMDDDNFDKEDDTYKYGANKVKDLECIINTIEVFLEFNESDNYARIADIEKEFNSFLFRVVPLNIADLFEEKILSGLNSGVFLSATLTVNNKMNYFTNTLGIDRFTYKKKIIEPIFNYKKRIQIITLNNISSYKNKEFINDISKTINSLCEYTNGHILSLFNSKDREEKTYNILRDLLHQQGIEIYLDKRGIKYLKELNKKCVVLGSKGCFEGVDVPGDGLICVTLDKIPNLNPNDPLYSTIMKKFNKQYYEVNQPQMIIKLKQAMGRILRSKYDYGCFVIFDSGNRNVLNKLKSDLHNCDILSINVNDLKIYLNNHFKKCRREVVSSIINDISENNITNSEKNMNNIMEYVNEEIKKRRINATIELKDENNFLLKYFGLKYLINKDKFIKN